MKRLLFLISLMVVFVAVNAQKKVNEVAPDGYITQPEYIYIWGSTADTLSNTDTLSYVFRVRGEQTQDFNIKLYSDHVSGTAGGTLKAYNSIDGINYTVFDTITVTSLSADAMDLEVISIDNYLYPYLKLIYIQSGTAVTIPKVFVYTKKD